MITPLGSKVLVKFIDFRREGAIIIPDKHAPPPVEADVIALGPQADHALNKGDRVCVSRMGGTYITHNEEDVCLVDSDDIIMIMNGND